MINLSLSSSYLDVLHSRVKCYFQRIREETAWKNYEEKLSPSIIHPIEHGETSKMVTISPGMSGMRQKLIKLPSTGSPESKNKSIAKYESGNYLIDSHCEHCKNRRKINTIPGIVNKELIITPQQSDFKKLVPKVTDAVSKSFTEDQIPTYLPVKETKMECPIFHPYDNDNLSTRAEPTFKFYSQSNNKFIAHNSKESPVLPHQFEVTPTILFLESFVWEELLNDTYQELQKIYIENQERKKENFLNALRSCIQNLQVEEDSNEEVNSIEVKNIACSKGMSEVEKASSTISCNKRTPGLKPKKKCNVVLQEPQSKQCTKTIVLELEPQKVASILEGQSIYEAYAKKVWPPISHFEDFHSISIQVSDAILNDALREVVQEFDTISGHIVQSCYKQEMVNIGSINKNELQTF